MHCRFLKKLGLVVKEASSTSPADLGDSGGGDDGDTQANATTASANVEDTGSTGLVDPLRVRSNIVIFLYYLCHIFVL